jgi:hypothetical protein
MIEHLARRGENWVKNAQLQTRPKGYLYAPNYPAAGASVRSEG